MTYTSSSLTEPAPAWSAYWPKDDVAWAPTVTGCVRNYVFLRLRRNFSRITAMLRHRRRNQSRSRKVSDVPERAASASSCSDKISSHWNDRTMADRPTLSRLQDITNTPVDLTEDNRLDRYTGNNPTPSYYEGGYGDFTDLLPDSVLARNVSNTAEAMLRCSSLESLWELDGSWASGRTSDEDRISDGRDESRHSYERRVEEGLLKRFVDLHDLTSVSVSRHCIRTGRLLLTGDSYNIFSGSMTTYHPRYSSYARSVCIHTIYGLARAEDTIRSLKNVLLLRRLQHPHLLEVLGVCLEGLQDGDIMWVLTSRIHFLVTLQRLLRWTNEDNPKLLTPRCACSFARQICEALRYLQSVGIPHGNLMSSTVMLDGQCDVKLSGVGLHAVNSCQYRWLAPECFNTGSASPVWSFGVVLWEIESVGVLPYPHLNSRAEVWSYLVNGKRLIRPERCTNKLYNIMKSCWNTSARRRPSFNTLLSSLASYHRSLPPSRLPHELFPDREHFWDVLQDYL